MILNVLILFGGLSSFAVGLIAVPNGTVVQTKQGDAEFTQLLVLFTQFLTEVRTDIAGLKTSITRVETEMEKLRTETGKNVTCITSKTNQLTTDLLLIRDRVVPEIKGNIGTLQRQVGDVSQSLTSLKRVAITDVKFGSVERSAIWKGIGYNDQVGYIITEVSNWNRDELADTAGRRKLFKMVDGNWRDVGA